MIKVLSGQVSTITVTVDERWRGAPTASSCEVRAQGAGDFVAVASSVDSLDVVTSAISHVGEQVLRFASPAAMVAGRRYLLLVDGRGVVLQVESVSGNNAHLTDPLLMTVPVGSRVLGQSVIVTLPSALAIAGDALLRLGATVGGVERRWTTQIAVMRNIAPIPISAQDLLDTHPDARRLRDAVDTTMERAISAGWEVVLHELRRRGYHEDRIRSSSALSLPTKSAVMLTLMRNASPESIEVIAQWSQAFRTELDGAVASSEFWYDAPDKDVAKPTRTHPTLSETFQITR
jgi:hypothetical protein